MVEANHANVRTPELSFMAGSSAPCVGGAVGEVDVVFHDVDQIPGQGDGRAGIAGGTDQHIIWFGDWREERCSRKKPRHDPPDATAAEEAQV
jgi:hypothetical protein